MDMYLSGEVLVQLVRVLGAVKLIPWDILPPGESPWNQTGQGAAGSSAPSEEDLGRLEFFRSLGSLYPIRGREVFSEYVGFVFMGPDGSGKVFLENAWTANAVYVFSLCEGLVSLITLTKAELLNGRPTGFIGRIVHQGDWQAKVKALLS